MNHLNTVQMGVRAALALAVLSSSTSAFAAYQNVGDKQFLQVCPQHVGGDREYDGHGPEVNTRIDLLRSSERDVRLIVDMHQIETVADWSEAQLSRSFHLGTLPSKATHYWARDSEGEWGWKPFPNSPVFDSVEHYFVDSNHSALTVSSPDWWIRWFRINGDTGGTDIGNCTSDDAYISIYLNSIRVMY